MVEGKRRFLTPKEIAELEAGLQTKLNLAEKTATDLGSSWVPNTEINLGVTNVRDRINGLKNVILGMRLASGKQEIGWVQIESLFGGFLERIMPEELKGDQ